MPVSAFECALSSVYEQALVQNVRSISLSGEFFPVRTTAKQKLKQVDFRVDGRELRALEQNPATNSRWAALARKGSKVMQFLEHGRYIAVIVDGKLHLYGKSFLP
jgi:hypothetical protein